MSIGGLYQEYDPLKREQFLLSLQFYQERIASPGNMPILDDVAAHGQVIQASESSLIGVAGLGDGRRRQRKRVEIQPGQGWQGDLGEDFVATGKTWEKMPSSST